MWVKFNAERIQQFKIVNKNINQFVQFAAERTF